MSETNLMNLGAAAAALATADRVGILSRLLDGTCAVATLADEFELDAPMTRIVLDVLESIDAVVVDSDERYALGPLVRDSISLNVAGRGATFDLWARTERLVREGAAAAPTRTNHDRGLQYQDVAPRLGAMFSRAAARLADALVDLDPRMILDVGAGSGVWSLALAARAPAARVTALDLPDVVDCVRRRAVELGVDDRVATLPGDFMSVPLAPAAFDIIIVAGVLHLEPAPRARTLLERVRPALAPGGALVVVDVLDSADAERRQAHAAYALHLALRLPGARPHPESELRAWLDELDLATGPAIDLSPAGPTGLGALVAREAGNPE